MKIDLHSHTHFSDGKLSPTELVTRAHTMMLDVLAITDHDSVAGIDEALAFQATQKRPLCIIAGIELSCAWQGFDIHILGFQIEHTNPRLLERLAKQSRSRQLRAEQICDKLTKAGVPNVLDEAKALARVSVDNAGQLTRAHIAQALLNRGVVKDFDDAFRKYLGKGKRAHVKPDWVSIQTAVEWITEAGGQAVLAHPGRYDLSAKWLRRLVTEFKAAGGEGMELNQGQLATQKWALLTELAQEHQLKGASGSDFHTPTRWTELGRKLALPDKITPIWHDWSLPQI